MDLNILNPGTLHVITGGMKGRKTPLFLHYFDQLQYTNRKTQIFKPECDYRQELHERYNHPREYIVSRTGMALPATEVDDKNPSEILAKLDPQADVIGIEEITLFEQGDRLVEIILGLIRSDKVVICSGLDKNFRGEPFHPMPLLMAYATTVEKNYGICDIVGCDNLGEYPQRIINGEPAHYDSPIKLVGAAEAYEIRCLKHHQIPGKK
ncbi:MAG: thymidine kinase [Candidatus Woesearchaeota archaeon]